MARNTRALGWREWVVFPDFDHMRVKAKVDTGARTSAIHAQDIEIMESASGRHVVFTIFPNQDDDLTSIRCKAPLVGQRLVTNSGGQAEERFIVRIGIQIGPHAWPIELSLADRDSMGFRMLLGRAAVRRDFVVFPGRSFLAARSAAAVLAG